MKQAPRRLKKSRSGSLTAAEVYSRVDLPGAAPAPDVANARDILEAAGIPAYLEPGAIPE